MGRMTGTRADRPPSDGLRSSAEPRGPRGRRRSVAAAAFAWLALLPTCVDGSTRSRDGEPTASGTSALAPSTTSGSASDASTTAPDLAATGPNGWSESELMLLRSIALDALGPPPADPSNRVADDPKAAELGHRLFFDARLSSNGKVSCASCHDPARHFTDGLAVSVGVGRTNRNAPTVVGAAWSPWQFWDGRRDSLWAQALAPFESTAEMNFTRLEVVRHVATAPELRALFIATFGGPPLASGLERLPKRASPFGDPAVQDAWYRMTEPDRIAVDRAFAQVGKAIAAYQRLLVPGPARFDRYVAGLASADRADPSAPAVGAGSLPAGDPTASLDERERLGLRLFIDSGRTQCLRCHNGPLLTNQGFHRIGTDTTPDGMTEFGRFLGLQAALVDPFNCLGPFSDAKPADCRELQFLRRDHLEGEIGKFKTPALRGLSQTAPYMHDGRFATLAQVVEHYRVPPALAPAAPGGAPSHELLPLELTPAEVDALVAFLGTLDGPVAAEPRWLIAPAQPTRN